MLLKPQPMVLRARSAPRSAGARVGMNLDLRNFSEESSVGAWSSRDPAGARVEREEPPILDCMRPHCKSDGTVSRISSAVNHQKTASAYFLPRLSRADLS